MSRSLPYVVLAAGRFGPEQLRINWTDQPRSTLPEIERLIDVEWKRRSAMAKETGQILFNGQLARYVSHQVGDGCLHIAVGPTNYRDFVGTNLYNNRRVEEFGWRRFANPVGTTGLIISADGHIVLGRRSGRVAYHGGYLHTIGGALEACDCADPEHIDAFAAVRRELREEVNISGPEVASMECIGLARDTEILQPELLFEVRISVSADELRRQLDPADPEQEHVGLECCPDRPDAVVDFLHDAAPVAPVAIAALLMRGSLAWGAEWYAAAAAEL